MVHALEEIWRLLKPQGWLIDIHPVAEFSHIKVFQRGTVLFTIPKPETYWEDVFQAEGAIAQLAERGLFLVERVDEFDYLTYASSVGELRAHRELINAFDKNTSSEARLSQEEELYSQVEAVLHEAGEGAEVAFHERGRVARIKPVVS